MKIDGNGNPFLDQRNFGPSINITVNNFNIGGPNSNLQTLLGAPQPNGLWANPQQQSPLLPDPRLNFLQKLLGMLMGFLGGAQQAGNPVSNLLNRIMQFFGNGNGQQQKLPPQYKTGAGAILKVSGKAAEMAADPKIKAAMEFMQTQQAKAPGQTIKQTVKGSDGKKYNLRLDPNGNFDIKPKSSFFGGIGKFLGGIAKGALNFAGGITKTALNFATGGIANKVLGGLGGNLFGGIADKVMGGISGFANKILGGIGGVASKFLGGSGGNFLSGITNKLFGGLGGNLLGGITNKLFGGISGIAGKLLGGSGGNLLGGITNKLFGGISGIAGKFLGGSGGNFLSGIAGKLFGGLGGNLLGGITNKLFGGISGIASKILGGSGGNFLSGIANKIFGGLGGNLLGGITDKIKGVASGFVNKAVSSFSNLISKSNPISIGTKLLSGLFK